MRLDHFFHMSNTSHGERIEQLYGDGQRFARSDPEKQLNGRSVDDKAIELITGEAQEAEAEHQRAVETHGVAKVNHEQHLQRKER